MNFLVMLTEDYDGVIDNPKWCASSFSDTNRTVCGDAVDSASHCVAIGKTVKRGGITCPLCMRIILEIKSIKL